jgi:hypothetical protein
LEAAEAPVSAVILHDEKADNSRSGPDASHLGQLTDSCSEKTIFSNSTPHFRQRNSYSGICFSFAADKNLWL